MATPRSTRRQGSNPNSNSVTPTRKDTAKKLEIVLETINPETSEFTRADGSIMERQIGSGYCEAIKANVIVTRNLFDKDGNEKSMLQDHHIGNSLQALVNKVTDDNGSVTFFAEVSLSRSASQESIDLFDSI